MYKHKLRYPFAKMSPILRKMMTLKLRISAGKGYDNIKMNAQNNFVCGMFGGTPKSCRVTIKTVSRASTYPSGHRNRYIMSQYFD